MHVGACMRVPESATMSVVLSPFREKLPMRSARSEVGGGRSLFARERLAVVESLLPKSTVYDDPPNCRLQKSMDDCRNIGAFVCRYIYRFC